MLKKIVFRLVGVFLFLTLYPLSYLSIRRDNKWLFGSLNGNFSENSKYLYLWTKEHKRDISVHWITTNRKQAKHLNSLGIQAHARWSVSGVFHTLTSKAFIYTHTLRDLNIFLSGGAKKINLWHGVGIKNIEFKIRTGPLKKRYKQSLLNAYRLLYPEIFIRPDLLLAPSPFMGNHFKECFRIKDSNIIHAVYPRTELQNEAVIRALNNKIFSYKEIEKDIDNHTKSYIYMPTWRDNGKSGIESALPSLEKINYVLSTSDSILYIKAHPNNKFELKNKLSHIKILPNNIDIYPILGRFSHLITDYSSVLYDALALGVKNFIFYLYDHADFIENSRDLAFPFQENIFGSIIQDESTLINFFESSPPLPIYGDRSELINKFWGNTPRAGANYIYEKINKACKNNET